MVFRFISTDSGTAFSTIRRSLGDFGKNLSEGIAHAIAGVAYVGPSLVILILSIPLLRLLWRRIM